MFPLVVMFIIMYGGLTSKYFYRAVRSIKLGGGDIHAHLDWYMVRALSLIPPQTVVLKCVRTVSDTEQVNMPVITRRGATANPTGRRADSKTFREEAGGAAT